MSIPPDLLAKTHFLNAADYFRNPQFKVDISTDDWPFLYMPRRIYPLTYLITLGLVLLVSFVPYASFLRGKPQTAQLPFFFLGAGFMLVETKAITEMGLTFGIEGSPPARAMARAARRWFLHPNRSNHSQFISWASAQTTLLCLATFANPVQNTAW